MQFWGNQTPPEGPFLDIDALYFNPSGSYIQTAVSEHFLSNSHSVSHMLLIPSIKTLRYERNCLRKASEAHLTHKAKTIEPLGVNKRDEL